MTDGGAELRRAAGEHLWLHFSKPGSGARPDLPLLVRGEGAYVYDSAGNRYLDALAGLFAVQVGHGRRELAEAAARQAETLGYYPIWIYPHAAAAAAAERIARLAPGDLNRVFFTSGGSEAVESAWKLARQYYLAIGQPAREKVISRHLAYHGTTLGALAVTGLDVLKSPFLPLLNGKTRQAANTNRLRCAMCAGAPACTLACADDIERAILAEGPETVAAVFVEPVQNAGGCFAPPDGYFQRVREICDRHGVLLVSDEVICAFGRLGDWFGSTRLGYQPDMITFAKGATSGYAPLGGVIASDRVAAPFLEAGSPFVHGLTFGGHPVCCAVALANIDLIEREGLNDRVVELEPVFRQALETLCSLPLVEEVRGKGYFWAVEMSKQGEPFSAEERNWLIREFLIRRLPELGVIARVDDRGDPIVQVSPPLTCGPEEFELIAGAVRRALGEAWERVGSG